MSNTMQQRGPRVNETQAKFIQDRINHVEKHLGQLCTVMSNYSRRVAKLRDTNDEFAKVITNYAESESMNRTLQSGLMHFGDTISAIGDHRNAEVMRLEAKVIGELSQYSSICRHAKEDVKHTFTAREKETNKQRQLDKLRERTPRNRQQISVAETELQKASADVKRTVRTLEEQVDVFENRKIHDTKNVLLSFVTIELSFHARALELFTKAYQDLQQINEEKDLQEFRSILKSGSCSDPSDRLETVRRLSYGDSRSLPSLANIEPFPQSSKSDPYPHVGRPALSAPAGIQSLDSLKRDLEDSFESEEESVEDEEEDEEESDVDTEDEEAESVDVMAAKDSKARRMYQP